MNTVHGEETSQKILHLLLLGEGSCQHRIRDEVGSPRERKTLPWKKLFSHWRPHVTGKRPAFFLFEEANEFFKIKKKSQCNSLISKGA